MLVALVLVKHWLLPPIRLQLAVLLLVMVQLLLLTWLFHCYCFDCFCCSADTEGCCSKTIALHVWIKEGLVCLQSTVIT
jgi:hypothetical protein